MMMSFVLNVKLILLDYKIWLQLENEFILIMYDMYEQFCLLDTAF
jgi:hypothetical protein